MKRIKDLNQLELNESYIVFVGYNYPPSGFDIGTFNLSGNLELQGYGDSIPFSEEIQVFTLPDID